MPIIVVKQSSEPIRTSRLEAVNGRNVVFLPFPSLDVCILFLGFKNQIARGDIFRDSDYTRITMDIQQNYGETASPDGAAHKVSK